MKRDIGRMKMSMGRKSEREGDKGRGRTRRMKTGRIMRVSKKGGEGS